MGERGPCYCANHGDCHYECRDTAPPEAVEVARAVEGLGAAVEQQAEIERLRGALRRIAFFPGEPEHRDLSFSQAVWRMQAIAAEAIAAGEGGR